jgi:hypothetical protein
MLYKRFIANDNTKWKTQLDETIDIYNNSPHRGIFGYTPHEAMNDEEIIEILKSCYREVSIDQGDAKKSDVQMDDTVRGKTYCVR